MKTFFHSIKRIYHLATKPLVLSFVALLVVSVIVAPFSWVSALTLFALCASAILGIYAYKAYTKSHSASAQMLIHDIQSFTENMDHSPEKIVSALSKENDLKEKSILEKHSKVDQSIHESSKLLKRMDTIGDTLDKQLKSTESPFSKEDPVIVTKVDSLESLIQHEQFLNQLESENTQTNRTIQEFDELIGADDFLSNLTQ